MWFWVLYTLLACVHLVWRHSAWFRARVLTLLLVLGLIEDREETK